MAESTCDIPQQSLFVRKEYLHDIESHHGEYERAYWFAIHSWTGRALDCIVHTEYGCLRDQLPLPALCTKPHPRHLELDEHQLWNCFSYNVYALAYAYLDSLPCQVILKTGVGVPGHYLFTVEWYGDNPSEMPGDEGRKSGHVVELDCGCIVMSPNNRMIVYESSFATKAPGDFQALRERGYKVNTRAWRAERSAKWVSEDSGQFFYELKTDR